MPVTLNVLILVGNSFVLNCCITSNAAMLYSEVLLKNLYFPNFLPPMTFRNVQQLVLSCGRIRKSKAK